MAESQVAPWPDISLDGNANARDTLHMWTQIVGKIRTRQMPWINHSWHCTLYTTPRGLTTLNMPHGDRSFQIEFDFQEPALLITADDGATAGFALESMSVADFFQRTMEQLGELDLPVRIHGAPNEVTEPIPFAEDDQHNAYDEDWAKNLHRALVSTDRVMNKFRAGFVGKCSPVHFFWGSFDMAVTRFSGRPAPPHPGGFPHMPDWITREAYSHEVSSCGFWPSDGKNPAFFYAYAYPVPEKFAEQPALPEAASYSQEMGEFVLPYAAVQESATPEDDLLAFFESTYEAAANCADWDRTALEWDGPQRKG